MSTYNILNVGKEDLEIVLHAYNQGKSDFFIAGKKYWLSNLFEIKIFEFNHPEKFDAFIELAKRNGLYQKSMFSEPHLTPEVLIEGGDDVTRTFIKGEFGNQQGDQTDNGLKKKIKMEIFISHSSDDSDKAEALINVILKAFKLENKSIRCTSVAGFKLPSGVSTDEQLKQEIFASKVFIGIITSRSINSTYVLFELGARWGTTLPLLPIICDPVGTSLLRGPLKNINVLNATDASDILQFIYDLSEHLDIKPEDTNAYLKEIEILKNLSSNSGYAEEELEIPKQKKKEVSDFDNADALIKEHSKKEWPDDYEMQVDFIENQRKAVEKLKRGKPDDIDEEAFIKIRERAKKEWPFDFAMRLATEERQIESLRKLNEL